MILMFTGKIHREINSLADFYRCFLEKYMEIMSYKDFYENLDEEQIKTLMEMTGIVSLSRGEDPAFDVMMDRFSNELIEAYKRDGAFTRSVLKVIDNVTDFFKQTGDMVGSSISSAWNKVSNGLLEFWNSVCKNLNAIIDGEFSFGSSDKIDSVRLLAEAMARLSGQKTEYSVILDAIRDVLLQVDAAEALVVRDPLSVTR